MGEAKTIVKYGRIYALANVVNRSAGLILIPLYTHYLSPEEYGVWALVLAVSDLFSFIFGMGFSSAMGRFYFDFPDNSDMRKKVVSTTMLSFFVVALMIGLTARPLASLVVGIVFNSQQYVKIFTIAITGLIFIIFYEIEISYAVIQKRAWMFLYMASGKATLFLGFNLLFVVYLKLGVIGIVYSLVSSLGILSIVVGGIVFWEVGFNFSLKLSRQLMAFGLPLAPSAIANAAMRLVERHYLNALAGPAAVGTFALANRLASLLQMFVAAPFSQIFFVRRFETMIKGEDQDVFHRILLVFVAVMASFTLFLSLFGVEILNIIAPSGYMKASLLIPVMGLCYILSAINLNIELGILFNKKTWAVTIIGFISLGTSVLSNYYLISLYGMLGAALSYVLINIVRLSLTVVANSFFGTHMITLDWYRTALILFLSIGLGIGIVYISGNNVSLKWVVIKIITLGGFLTILFSAPILGRESRTELIGLLKKRR